MKPFLGKSNHTLDEKGRLILPKRFLARIPEDSRDFHLTVGPEGCLILFDAEGWAEVSKQVSGEILGDQQLRVMRRLFLGHAEEVKPDKSNRIIIAELLREFAGLGEKGDVVLVGTGRSIEIWAKSRFETSLNASISKFDDLFSHNTLIGSAAAQQS